MNRWRRFYFFPFLLVFLSASLSGTGCYWWLTPINPPGFTPPPGNSGVNGKYIGSEKCAQCHQRYHDNWAGTLHSKALDNLEAIGQGTNGDCLVCHTVGYGDDGGYVDRATTNVLAGVGCESCHGPAAAHVANVTDPTVRPVIDISSGVCGKCHTGDHQPQFDQWQTSGHATVTSSVASNLVAGTNANTCGLCHSGDARLLGKIQGQTVPPNLLAGVPLNSLNAVTCAICHDPHLQTGNAAAPVTGRDYQLRYVQLKISTASNTIAGTQDETRFEICGQCHHDRGATYNSSTSRGPHHSVQENIYLGEMAMPDGEGPLVQSLGGPHNLAPRQCATCHLLQQKTDGTQNPTYSEHTFAVNFAGCVISGCHQSADAAKGMAGTLQNSIQNRLSGISAGLGNPAKWEYSSSDYGGPTTGQDSGMLADPRFRQIRFIYHYLLEDQSLGVHNPAYFRALLDKAEELLGIITPIYSLPLS